MADGDAQFERACPHCGRVNDRHSGPATGDQPAAGDVGICWKCGGLAYFTDNGMRKPTAEELVDLEADPEIRGVQAIIRESYYPSQAAALRRGQ